MMRWRFCVALVFAIIVALGCGDHHARATGLMVVVEADPAVMAVAVGMRLVVHKGEGAAATTAFEQTYTAIDGDLTWPRTLSLSPRRPGDDAALEIVASALNGTGETLASVRAITHYVPGQVKRLRLLIEGRCLGITCGRTETCRTGGCVRATIDPNRLPNIEEVSDAAVDAPPDASWDAGTGECRVGPGSSCGQTCIERCNGRDDDCDGVVDNGASGMCNVPNAEAVCANGECIVVACQGDYADCNGQPQDGCEATLATLDNCGVCGATCLFPHAGAMCRQGFCLPDDCDDGFGDCDGQPNNGCESSLTTLEQCGDCATACEVGDNALPDCTTGVCRVGECLGNHADCDADPNNGCEQSLNDPAHCGSCGNACDTGTPHCSGGVCRATSCPAGEADCDGDEMCEQVNSATDCSGCGVACPATVEHGTATCSTGTCVVTCDDHYANCDGSLGNGCERALNTESDCGACNVACAFPNAAGACSDGACNMGACNPGFGNCDGTTSNGCETQLSSTANCGACDSFCTNDQVCNNGACGPPNCPSGFSYCGGDTCIDIRGSCPPWPGCANPKLNTDHCGACNNRCPLNDGQYCCL